MRFNARTPTLALLPEIDVVVEDLRLLFEGQLADVDDGAPVGELRKVALPQPASSSFINMLPRGQQEAVAVLDRRAQLRECRCPVLYIVVAQHV